MSKQTNREPGETDPWSLSGGGPDAWDGDPECSDTERGDCADDLWDAFLLEDEWDEPQPEPCDFWWEQEDE